MAPYLVRGCPGVLPASGCPPAIYLEEERGNLTVKRGRKSGYCYKVVGGGLAVFRPIVWKISGLYTGVKRVVAGCAVSCVVIILICIFLCESRSITIFSVFSVCTY